MKILNIKGTLTVALVLSTTALMAQSSPPATPIDGGLGILLACGTAYGLKKLRDLRNNH